MLNKILMILIFIASALVTVVIYNLIALGKYQECWNAPLTEMPSYCKDLRESKAI